MTLHWTLIAGFLYLEVALCALFILPIFSAERWRRIFNSRLLKRFRNWSSVYFNIFLGLLVMMVFDGWREARRHSEESRTLSEKLNPNGHARCLMRMFRAQRNLYIAGGAVLLWLLLRWMVRTLIVNAKEKQISDNLRSEIDSLNKQLAELRAECGDDNEDVTAERDTD